jgi:hypothetical protein
MGLESIQAALDIYEVIGSMTSQANIYFFLGQMIAANGHIKEGLPFIEKAVEIGAGVAPDHPVTQYMQNVLEALRAQLE